MRYFGIALLAFLLTGCASTLPTTSICTGEVIAAPVGLVEVNDPALLQSAVGAPGAGGLCRGKVFEVVAPVPVFRVWAAAGVDSAFGRWWSLTEPEGPRDAYRIANGICREWSALDRASRCVLKAGARVVIGPGQSAQCNAGLLAQSAVNQVYVPNDTRKNVLWVENCTPGAPWPAGER